MSKLKVFVIVLVLTIFGMNVVFAQKTTIYIHEDGLFKEGLDLFEKQKYGAAQKVLSEAVARYQQKNPHSVYKADAEYYLAVCAMELFHKDAELLLKNFIKNHPENPKVKQVYFHLGKYHYRKKKYQEAIAWFEKVDVYDLKKEELPEYYFKRGYSYFDNKQYEKAKKDFYEIKDIDTKYTAPALYYYSHVAYSEKNYETAAQGFLRLKNNENFGPVVPYYIAQIYFLQGKYNEVIAYAPALLDSADTKRGPEIARLIGESYYRTGRYKESIPFLQRYVSAYGGFSREEVYVLAYAYYQTGDLDNATTYFQNVINQDDSLTQNAYYHLADCYIKKGNKQYARSAFSFASKYSFDKEIEEDALFHYAKLSYELSFDPFSEATRALQSYIDRYPLSSRFDEAYTYLVNVYLSAKNYKEALRSLEEKKALHPGLQPAYQKIAFNRGVELFNLSNYDDAIQHFEKALKYREDKALTALSSYWNAEALYRKKAYEKAVDQYKIFMSTPGSFSMPEYNNANYNIGYCYFQMKEYATAGLWFRKFVGSKSKENNKRLNDAYIRIGDTYFMNKDFSSAAEYYSQAIKMKGFDTDYALYQHALAMGLQKNFKSKVNDLLSLLREYPKSNYSAVAKFELGKTYFALNEQDKAFAYYKQVTDEHPKSSFVNKAQMQLALIHFNKQEDSKALDIFNKIVREDRKSAEANEALSFIEKIFIARNDVDGLEKYFKEVSVDISNDRLDSTSFEIAKNHYMEQNCAEAIEHLAKYISKFPAGIFITEANFYKAECDYKSGNYEPALAAYNFVINKPRGPYTETALVNAAAINYKTKNYQSATEHYKKLEEVAEQAKNKLESCTGQMRCNYLLKDYEGAILAATKITYTEKVSSELLDEAHLTIGKSAFETYNYELANKEFQITSASKNSEIGSEALYQLANMHFLKANYKETEKGVFTLIDRDPVSPYWMTKGLILLADNYLALNDAFQAKHTLKSVVDDSNIPELVEIAKEKLNKITESEKLKAEQEKQKAGEQITIPLDPDNPDEILFEESKKEGGTHE